MRKITLSILLVLSVVLMPTTALPLSQPQDNDPKVIICTGEYSKCYHKYKCRGIKNCKGEIKYVKLSEALKTRRKCLICYKEQASPPHRKIFNSSLYMGRLSIDRQFIMLWKIYPCDREPRRLSRLSLLSESHSFQTLLKFIDISFIRRAN